MKRIVFTGGGTAGHIYPCLAIKERLNPKEYSYFYIGGNGMEKDILKEQKDIKYFQIPTVKLERKLTLRNFLIPFKLIKSIREAKIILRKINPNIIFSKGGYVSIPVVIAAKKLKIPVISHESDLSMGLANKIILHYCDTMCTSFKETCKKKKKIVFTGQPIRKEIIKGDKTLLPFYQNFDKKKPCLLIVGGSSGSRFLNNVVRENLDYLCENFNCIHIMGKKLKNNLIHKNYFPVDYAPNIGDYLAAANFVLSRAGSGAINEFLYLKKPMFLFPLSKDCSRGDQIENAKLFSSLGLADMMEEEYYNKENFVKNFEKFIKNKDFYVKNMKKESNFDACDKIIKLIKETEKDD